MKATSGPLPTGDGWVYEMKWDGMRVLAEVGAGRRAGVERQRAGRRPGVPGAGRHSAAALAPVEAALDGEVVALDAGRAAQLRAAPGPDARDLARPRPLRRAAEVPVAYVVFDLLRARRATT